MADNYMWLSCLHQVCFFNLWYSLF